MKKILLLILALVLCLGVMVSCGDTTGDNNSDGNVNDGGNTDGGNAEEALQAAIDYVWASFSTTDGSEVRADFERNSVVIVGDYRYAIVWTTDNDKIQVVEKSDTAVTIKIPEVSEALSFKLTATISDSEGNSKSVSFNYTVAVTTSQKPVAGTAYKFAMVHTNLENKVLYITGAMNGYYMATTEDVAKAVNVYVEETEGGYYMYYKMADTGAKKYINMVVSGSYVNAKFEDTASTVYVYDEGLKTLKASVNDKYYVHGTQSTGTYTTLGPVDVSTSPCFGAFELAANGGEGGDHSHEFVSGKCGCGAIDPTYVAPDAPAGAATLEEGKGYYIAARNSSGYVYFNGSLNSGRFNGVASKADAAAVFVEATEGGFYLYFDAKGVKTYVVMADSSTGGSFATDKASATVFEWDADLKTLVVADDDNARAFGMDDTKTFTTFSCYAVSNTQYNWGIYIVAEGVTPPEYEEEPGTPDAPEHTHNFVEGKCECGESDPNYVAPEEPGDEPSVDAAWVPTTELKNGDLVLIGAANYGKLLSAEKVSASSFYNKGVNYSATDFANVTDAEIFVVTVNDDGTYTFTSLTGVVIALADSYSSLNDTGANKYWSLESRDDGTFLVKNTGRNLYLEWYASKDNWSTYSSANSDLFYMTFYVKATGSSEGGDTPDEPEHTHNFVEGKCECGESDPTYVPEHTHNFVEGKCECGESDPNYVAPEEPGDEPSDSETKWVVATELKNGDLVLIGAAAYGKLLSAEKVSASSFYNKGVNYSATDFANVTDAEIFVVTVNDDGTYTFTSLTGVVIALADSYSSLNDTGVNKSWSLEAKGENTFLVKNVVRGLYLEWYASKDNWSTYSNANSDLFEMTFYVQSTGASEEPSEPGTPETPDEPEHTHNFVEGKCECGESDPNYVAPSEPGEGGDDDTTAVVNKADFETMGNANASYLERTSASGWVAKNAALNSGNTTETDSNPKLGVLFGTDTEMRAVTLNGKTSAVGSLTSPLLSNGISNISFKCALAFSDKNGINITINIKNEAGEVVASRDVVYSASEAAKYDIKEVSWTLDEAVTGNFVIEIVNNCPSATDGNKDRTAIWDLTWINA